ncbi:hypothetical protein [Staphylococcus phage vB_StaM_PB50]|nr:hypothetical protein [Staphylococcus phage vB_StaM_PB50]
MYTDNRDVIPLMIRNSNNNHIKEYVLNEEDIPENNYNMIYRMKEKNLINNDILNDIIFNISNNENDIKELPSFLLRIKDIKGLDSFISENKNNVLYCINNSLKNRPINILILNTYYHILKLGNYNEISYIKEKSLVHLIPLYIKSNSILISNKDINLLVNDAFTKEDIIEINDIINLIFVLEKHVLTNIINNKTKKFITDYIKNNFNDFRKSLNNLLYQINEKDIFNKNNIMDIIKFIKDISKDSYLNKELNRYVKSLAVKNAFK